MTYTAGQALAPKDILELPVEKWLCRITNHTEHGQSTVYGFIPESRAIDKRARLAGHVENGNGTIKVARVDPICITLVVDIPAQVEGKIVVCTDPVAENSALMLVCDQP